MSTPADATATQLANIERSSGATVEAWAGRVARANLTTHGAMVRWLKDQGLTHGNANALAHAVRAHLAGGQPGESALLDAQYAGGKVGLRPIHDEIIRVARSLGDDVQVVVQKTAVSLRRAKQFAMVEAPSARRVRLGFNLRGEPPSGRVTASSGMCTHVVDLPSLAAIDAEVLRWLTAAYAAQEPQRSGPGTRSD